MNPTTYHDNLIIDPELTAATKAFAIKIPDPVTQNALDLVETYYTDKFISHNGFNGHGIAGMKELVMGFNAAGLTTVETVRCFAENDVAVTHNKIHVPAFGVNVVTFDLYRVEDGKAIEHWDVVTLNSGKNPAGRTQDDGWTEVTDHDKTLANKARAEAFIDHLINNEQPNFAEFMAPDLIQHSPDMEDGLEGMKTYLSQPDAPLPMLDMVQGNPIDPIAVRAQEPEPVHYEKLHFSVAEGNFVLAVSEGRIGEKGKAFYDLLRFEDGMIVEQWRLYGVIFAPGEAPNNQYGQFLTPDSVARP